MSPATQHLPPIVEAAAIAFGDATGIAVRPRSTPVASGADAILEFAIGAHRFKRPALVRQTVDRYGTLATIRAQATHGAGDRPLLVTTYLSPNIVDACRKMDLDAIDLAGNASVLLGDSVILVAGRPRPQISPLGSERVWSKSTLRVALALLSIPSLLKQSYRDIAQIAGVSHGTVQNAIRGMLARRDLIELPGGQGMQFTDGSRMIDEWTTLYPTLLRGSLQLGHYRTDMPEWWRNVPALPDRCRFGGEPAAAIFTEYLKPAFFTVYCTEEVPREWIAKARLRPDIKGNVEFVKSPIMFASMPDSPPNVVPPLLVYADLVASGDSRNLETARLLREQYLSA
ncbi:type IV toxin-antitoxin system AbiEi family antitoxin [Burkholderia pseudomallei]|uniref:type IV toxin-antitoxin system AbiEi family antitoxin n=1 Tax=Burkholderia pseudomallei TaxID=28450 RepID=UPI00314044B7